MPAKHAKRGRSPSPVRTDMVGDVSPGSSQDDEPTAASPVPNILGASVPNILGALVPKGVGSSQDPAASPVVRARKTYLQAKDGHPRKETTNEKLHALLSGDEAYKDITGGVSEALREITGGVRPPQSLYTTLHTTLHTTAAALPGAPSSQRDAAAAGH